MFTGLDSELEISTETMCSFTGYRPSKLSFLRKKDGLRYRKLYRLLKNEVIAMTQKGVMDFQTGMAQGIDLMCAEIVLGLKKHIAVRLFCAIPCHDQYQGWNEEDIALYKRVLTEADGVTYVSSGGYYEGCMQKRNRYLVDTAQFLIAVYDGQRGGTMSTVNYAKKKKRTVIIINPTDFTRVELLHGNEEGVLYV